MVIKTVKGIEKPTGVELFKILQKSAHPVWEKVINTQTNEQILLSSKFKYGMNSMT